MHIERLDADGFGTGSDDGIEFRVKAALPGETVQARILRKRRRVRLAEAVAVSAPAANRVPPRCPAFPRCGGCVLQHLSDTAALTFKARGLETALAAAGVAARRIVAPVAGPRLRYRRKARLGVKRLGDQVLVGFRESFSARVGRMQQCPVLSEPFTELLGPFAELIGELSIADRIPQLEVAAGDRDQQVIVRHLAPLEAADLDRLRAFEQRYGICLLLQPAGPDSITTLDQTPPPLLEYALPDFGLSLEFAAQEFTQVNAAINARLVADVLALVGSGAGKTAVDLFCGIGNFSLALAARGYRVWGFEAAAGAVHRARDNARRNGFSGSSTFAVADLYDETSAPLPAADTLVLDPPRSGAGPALPRWLTQGAAAGLQQVAYVSCNPTTFATDARVFIDHGFELTRVGAYDMFPHTSHVETLGLFQRW
ncbi:MAG: 23S rRNA (uracil(1939)-C(5))-methyltransferase [Pseudomonadota bacterium]